jgi:hypothetical protein
LQKAYLSGNPAGGILNVEIFLLQIHSLKQLIGLLEQMLSYKLSIATQIFFNTLYWFEERWNTTDNGDFFSPPSDTFSCSFRAKKWNTRLNYHLVDLYKMIGNG